MKDQILDNWVSLSQQMKNHIRKVYKKRDRQHIIKALSKYCNRPYLYIDEQTNPDINVIWNHLHGMNWFHITSGTESIRRHKAHNSASMYVNDMLTALKENRASMDIQETVLVDPVKITGQKATKEYQHESSNILSAFM